jgi:hypothetical protein
MKKSRGARGTTRDAADSRTEVAVAESIEMTRVVALGGGAGAAAVAAGEERAAGAATFRSGEGGTSYSSIL